MIAILLRAFLFYCIYIFVKGVFKGLKGEKPKKMPSKEKVIEAEFRRID